MAKKMQQAMAGVAAIVGGIIGLVIVADVVSEETYNPDNNETGTFEEGELETTVLEYLVPLLMLAFLATALTVWNFL